MASKPTRNNGSSPTNLSPSRPIRNSCSTSAAGRSTHGSNVVGGGSKKGTTSSVSSTPIGGRPGLTPKTQRKELAPVQNSNTPQGSPKINNNSTKKTSTSTSVSRKNSSKNNNINKRSSTGGVGPSARPSSSQSAGPPASTAQNITPTIKLREETKFDGLWEVKTIDNGLIRLPTQCLENLISKEGIEKYYEVEPKPVASGGISSTVRKCVHRETGITYAAKFSSRLRSNGYAMVDSTIEILHEIAVLSVCMDSNKIVHLKDVFQTTNEIILVLEYAPGGDFQSVLDEDMVPFEEDVQGFLRQILEALDFIHDRNIAHLDIKPQNIVLMGQFPNCEIKLCDLDVARVIQEDEDFKEIIGTPDYVAPEILEWKPITLAADIWSLGVCTYVLLTGFSPFGGDTDEETYINIHQAALDFPPELFEGVSDMAKEFISECLVKDPKKRPTIKQCLAHRWLATEEEPPSPSPLMLKIPTPDLSEPVHKISHGHGSGGSGSLGVGHHGPSGSRRSCQTCRDKITERKRYLSKSREAIFEKVNQSKLKKSLSKSRERLPVCGLTLSKSRDNLGLGLQDSLYPGGQTKVMSRQQNKMYGFCKSLSKSQEVISAALGGVPMKRMINGAVSDISHALKQQHQLAAAQGSHELPSPSIDYIFLPTGSGILVPQTAELMKINSGSLQVLPLTESGRSTPASQASVATVQDLPMSQAEVIVSNAANVVVVTSPPHSSSAANLVETPLIEVSEEDEEFDFKSDNPSQHSSSSTLNGGSVSSSSTSTVSSSERASSVSKDIKESQNYEKQKQSKKINNNNHHKINRRSSETSTTTNPLELELKNVKSSLVMPNNAVNTQSLCNMMTSVTSPILKETASVGIQVNLIQAEALDIVPGHIAHGLMPGHDHAQVLGPSEDSAPTSEISSPIVLLPPSQSSPRLTKKLAHLAQEPEEINLERHLLRNNKSNYESKTLPRRKSSNDVARLMKQSSMEEKPAPFRRGYTHDQMLGLDQKSTPAWREEINKIRSQKPFKISELIGTFDKRGQENQENNINNELSGANDISNNTTNITQTNSAAVELAALKKMRRNSLQIHFDPSDQFIKTAEDIENKKKEALLKTQRRKSTPTLLSNTNLETMKIQDQIVDILKTASEKEASMNSNISNNPVDNNTNENTEEKKDEEKPESKKEYQLTKSKQTVDENQQQHSHCEQQQRTKSMPLMHTPQKNWDYFESFDHPKAISDKKLQQLKAKFSRRSRTEGNLIHPHSLCHIGHGDHHQTKSHVKAVSSIKEENEDLTSPDSEVAASNSKPMLTDRSKSVPVSLGSQNLSSSLAPALSIDPLTGVCLAPSHTNCASSVPTTIGSAAPSTVSEASSDMDIVLEDLGGIRQTQSRRVSTDSGEESADSSSRWSSRSSIQQRRRSTYLSDIYEQQKLQGGSSGEPDHIHGSHHADDEIAVDTIVEVMIDPLTGKINTIEEKKPRRLSVEIMNNANTIVDQTVNGGGQTSLGNSATRSGPGSANVVDQGIHDDGFISLPHTPTDMGLLLDPKLKIAATGSSISSTASTNSASTSQLADVGISLTSSEETLTTTIAATSGSSSSSQNLMKKANSLEACDAGSDLSQSISNNKNSNRPASAAASTNTFVRAAREKFSSEKIPSGTTTTSTRKMSASGSTETTDSSVTTVPLLTNRRQSSPMIRPSSS